ncbi:MAG: hypothetical protein QOE45_2268 [Frankiaceae bacterium]|nr:hypothetical protein [Frankiaceae bacterium]
MTVRRSQSHASVRLVTCAAVCGALVLTSAQPFAYALPRGTTGATDQPDPEFLPLGARPSSSVVHPVGDASTAAPSTTSPRGRVVPEESRLTWDTHPSWRRTKGEAATLARSSGQRVRVTEDLKADSTTFANPDGTTTLELTSGPSRVRRGDGWADIDPTLVRRGDRYEAAAIDGSLTLSAGGDRDLLTFGRGPHAVSLGWPTDLPEPRIAGATATYPDAAPGVDILVRALRYGYEQSLLLHERPAGAPVYDVPLRLPNGQTARQAGGNIELLDRDGAVVGTMPQGLMFDAEVDPHAGEHTHRMLVSTRLVQTPTGLVIRYAPDPVFLADPGTVYPVTIDPPPSLGLVSDTEVDSGFPTTQYAGSTELRVGTWNGGANVLRSYIAFNTTSIAGMHVISANLKLWEFHSFSCTPKVMDVRAAGVSNSATTWSNAPTIYPTAYDTSLSFAHGYSASCPDALQTISATNLVQVWADNGHANAGLALRAQSETDNLGWKKFNSGNAGSNIPAMEVTFNDVPVVSSLVPAAGATVNDLTPNLSGIVSDSDDTSMTAWFYVKNSAGAWVTNGAQRTGTAGSRITYTVEGGKLADGQTYTWFMRGCDGTDCSPTTAPRAFTVNYGPPIAPATVSATAGDGTTTANWTAPSDNGGSAITSYHWELHRVSDGLLISQGNVDDLVLTASDSTVVNGTAYYWRVNAVNAAGSGPARNSANVTPSRTPGQPTNVVATAGNATSTVTWNVPASDGGAAVIDYTARLYRTGVVTPVYTSPAIAATSPRTATANGLTNGTGHYWTVIARNSRGTGDTGTSNTVTPMTTPGAPVAVAATEQTRPDDVVPDPANPPTTAAVTVSWTPPASNGGAAITNYQVQAYVQPANTAVYAQPVTACGSCTSVPLTGLKPGTRYTFGVIARNQVGGGAETRSSELLTHLPPRVVKAVTDTAATPVVTDPATGRPLAGRGDAVRFTVTVTNQQSQPAQIDSVVDTVPAGVVLSGLVTVDGQPCGSSCSLSGSTLTLGGGYQLAASATRTYTYLAVLTGSERACVVNAVNHAVARGPYGLHEATAATTACGSALGLEPWWSYLTTEVGAQAAASVNVANGNLVIQASDSTPVQAHGHLAYVLRRSYNSQDPAALTLPGGLGAGWTFNVGQTSDLAAEGVTATGLHVPRVGNVIATLTDPLSMTLIDRDGTRHVFSPKVGLPAISISGLTGPSAVLNPSVLTTPPGTELCVDVAYQAPAGVHLGLWRYVAIQPQAGAQPCANIAGRSPVVVGYAAMRPDRLRTEFNAVGQLVEMRDGAGVALRYVYDAPVAPDLLGKLRLVYEPRSCTPSGSAAPGCRQLHFDYPSANATEVTDSAGRVTRYELGFPTIAGLPAGVAVLRRVVNPEETAGRGTDHVDYSYQSDSDTTFGPTSCGGSRLQMCSVTDARGNRTTFHYDTAGSAAAGLSALGRIDQVTDRRGTATTVGYPAADRVVTIRGGQQQRAFTGIDQYGRVATHVDGPVGDVTLPAYQALHVTTRTWDGATNCAQPSGARDNNLCRAVGTGSANTANSGEPTPDADTSWLYNEQGQVLRERRVNRGSDGTVGSPANVDTTFGYKTQYVGTSSGVWSNVLATDTIAGSGAVNAVRPAGLTGLNTLYAISDRTETLTPRGNEPGRPFGRYRTEWVVDADPGVTPGAPPPAAGACPESTSTGSNTGMVCQEKVPFGVESDTTVATTSYGYDAFGQKTLKRTPRNGVYRYLYYGDGEQDLSAFVSAGGWLRAVTDPVGEYAAFAYDRAGNTVRTWDRDATDRSGYATAAAFPTGTGIAGFAETRYAPDSLFADAVAHPWRYVRWQLTPTGDTTRLDVDQHGDVLRLRPPRGEGATTSPYDTITTYDPHGHALTVQLGEDIANAVQVAYVYDAFGNVAKQVDQSGTPTVFAYDLVNRRVGTTVLRGPYPVDAADAPPACRRTTAADSAFGPDQLVCQQTTAYDPLDNVVVTVDADGQRTTAVFDSLHRQSATVAPRATGVTRRSETRYDADGHALTACSPRQQTEGTGGCTATSVYATHTVYDVAGRIVATTVYRAAGQALTTRTTYDADGNAVAVADPRQDTESGDHTVDQSFDLNDRRVGSDMPRAGVTTFQYSPSGDVVGVVAPGATGDNAGSGGSGRSVRITGYTYDASHRTVDVVSALQVSVADPATDPDAVRAATATATTNEAAQTNLRTRTVYDAAGNSVATFGPRAFAEGSVAAPDQRFMLRTEFDHSDRKIVQWSPRADGSLADDPTDDPTQAAHCPISTGPSEGLVYPAGTYVCKSTIAYDADGSAVEARMPSAAGDSSPRRIVYTYTEDRLVRETKAPNPAADGTLVPVSTVLYDGSGRPVSTTNALGHVALTAYTADGLVRSARGPDGPSGLVHETQFEYDANGNRTKEITPRASASDAPFTETTYYADNRVSAVYAGGDNGVRGDIVTSYEYDANGNPKTVTSPSANAHDTNNVAGDPTVNTYTQDNLVLTTTQPVVVGAASATQSRVTTYAYDAAARKTSVDVDLTGSPAVDGAPQTFAYFPSGQLKTETGRGGTESVDRAYDANGALVRATASGNGADRVTTVGYYLDGLPRQVTSGGRVTAYAYDGSDGRTALGEGDDAATLDVMRYAVDDAGLAVSMSSAESGSVDWAYNALGQRVTETRGGDRTQIWTYGSDDLLTRTAVTTSPTLAEQVRSGAAAADLASYSYTYDELSRQRTQSYYGLAATSPVGDVPAGSPVTYGYAYDAAGRLSSFSDARGTRTVAFDHDGNRTDYGVGLQPGATHFTYRADDSIASSVAGAVTKTYSYDQPFGGVSDDGCSAYTYDGLDRLTLVDAPAVPAPGCPTGDVSYAYDGFDRQVDRTGTGTVHLDYDGTAQTVLRQTGAAAGTLHYTVDASGAVVTARRGAGQVEHLAEDGTGSIGLVTTPTVGVACTARYDAYGSPDGNTAIEPLGSCNTGTAESDVFYRGNRKDTTTGQYQLGGRTYDPAKATFLTPDSYRGGPSDQNLGVGTDPLTRNTYSYVNGDPINLIDPSGHEPKPARGGGWSGAGCADPGTCSSDTNRETRVLLQKSGAGAAAKIAALMQSLDEAKRRDPNAYWDAVSRECQDYHLPLQSPGARICEQLYRASLSRGLWNPQHDMLLDALGVYDLKHCALQQKIKGCFALGVKIALLAASRGQAATEGEAEAAAAEDSVGAEVIMGRRGSPMDVTPGTNAPAEIDGLSYSGHALDEMQSEAFMPSVVKDAIENGQVATGASGRVAFYSSSNNITVVVEEGRIVTVTSGMLKIR